MTIVPDLREHPRFADITERVADLVLAAGGDFEAYKRWHAKFFPRRPDALKAYYDHLKTVLDGIASFGGYDQRRCPVKVQIRDGKMNIKDGHRRIACLLNLDMPIPAEVTEYVTDS